MERFSVSTHPHRACAVQLLFSEAAAEQSHGHDAGPTRRMNVPHSIADNQTIDAFHF
jgi:hypothetical protein